MSRPDCEDRGIRKLSGPLETWLQRLLFQYRVTPHSTMGALPAEFLMGRKLRTHLDRIYPNVDHATSSMSRRGSTTPTHSPEASAKGSGYT